MENTIKLDIKENGLLIPKFFFNGISKVEVHREKDIVTIYPDTSEDSIFNLGSNPVECKLNDASDNLDKYIY